MTTLPPAIIKHLVALSLPDADFAALCADTWDESGGHHLRTRDDYVNALWMTLSDLLSLATMPCGREH